MPRAAVLGKPVAHSRSPVIHRAGYAAAGLTGWSYEAIECAEAELAGLVASLGPEWAGLSLTMPLKEVALAVAGVVSPLAATIGAANTLVRRPDGTWRAENTDAPGIADVLGRVPTGAHLVVLGAGGTARAALGAAAGGAAAGGAAAGGAAAGGAVARGTVAGDGAGADAAGGADGLAPGTVSVVARRPEALAALDPVAADLGIEFAHHLWPDAADVIATADVVISTLPAGAADPLAASVSWRAGAVLLDAIYHPWPTALARSAATAGCRVASGLDLLLAQAVGQFHLFTGVPAPRAAMRTALTGAPPA